ncbi:MAG: hypothetical protein SX243_05345 [Acidobacteriota bacterium]|nr:hypothetical protein [Acidobacteriota bacterium]
MRAKSNVRNLTLILIAGLIAVAIGIWRINSAELSRAQIAAFVESATSALDHLASRGLLDDALGESEESVDLNQVGKEIAVILREEMQDFEASLRPRHRWNLVAVVVALAGIWLAFSYSVFTGSAQRAFDYFSDLFQPASKIDLTVSGPEIVTTVTSRLENRAQIYQFQAISFLSLSILASVAGIALFLYSGHLVAKEEAQATDLLEEMVDDMSDASSSLAYGFERIADDLAWGRLEPQVAEAISKIETDKIDSQIANLQAIPLQVSMKLIEDKSRLIATTTTRIGSILLLIFLVKVFVSAYRYSSRMFSFYSSRVDIMLLLGTEYPSDLALLAQALGAEQVSFPEEGPNSLERLLAQRSKGGD